MREEKLRIEDCRKNLHLVYLRGKFYDKAREIDEFNKNWKKNGFKVSNQELMDKLVSLNNPE